MDVVVFDQQDNPSVMSKKQARKNSELLTLTTLGYMASFGSAYDIPKQASPDELERNRNNMKKRMKYVPLKKIKRKKSKRVGKVEDRLKTESEKKRGIVVLNGSSGMTAQAILKAQEAMTKSGVTVTVADRSNTKSELYDKVQKTQHKEEHRRAVESQNMHKENIKKKFKAPKPFKKGKRNKRGHYS